MKTILTLIIAALGFASVNAQTIRNGQSLQISITGVPVSEQGRLNAMYSVSGSGYITMWKIGSIKASGMTKSALASSIAAKYKAAQIYTSPVFQVQSKTDERAIDNRIFTVGGQVRSPGQKPWIDGMTLYSAVQAAGGETPYGAVNRVKLYRNGKAYVYDLRKQTHKGVKIYHRDVIEVPETNLIGR